MMKWQASISRIIAWFSQADGTVVPVTYATLSLNFDFLENYFDQSVDRDSLPGWAGCLRWSLRS
jgi:hypothetical protein